MDDFDQFHEIKRVSDLVGEDTLENILRMLQNRRDSSDSVLTGVFRDKLHRTAVHTAIREVFKGVLDTTTTIEEKIMITFSKSVLFSFLNMYN